MTEHARALEPEGHLQDSPSRFSRRLETAAAQDATALVAAHPEGTARAHRSHARSTLQPSVQDFNGKIMNRTTADIDEDQLLWTVGAGATAGGRPCLKLHLSKHPDDPQTPLPATFRWATSPVTPLHLDSARLPLAPSVIKTERVAAWTEDVHRRHVARTARARSRLTPKPWMTERVVPSGQTGAVVDSGLEPSFSLTAAPEVDIPEPEDARCPRVKPSKKSPSKDYTAVTSRSRPATTTGRYFDKSNGLRSNKSAAMARSRPKTAAHWSWTSPGLNIQKVVLHPKDII